MKTAAAALFVLVLGATALAGQRVYTWQDERGVLHFSDQPPPPGAKASEKWVEPLEPVGSSAPESGTSPAGEAEAPRPAPAEDGRPQVVVTSRMASPVAERVWRISGEVRNTGGGEARRVAVIVRVTDPGQGTECLTTALPVEPADLPPGATGKFEDYLESPCFLGNAGVEVVPEWN
ncbi:MAG: hypothetical protein KatS3mg076_2911 [Candidatus Binatia bacterium]|nr:MAG: hypothetical protein KatS3mg076_2911 [Candidatus Binatia bacterium]